MPWPLPCRPCSMSARDALGASSARVAMPGTGAPRRRRCQSTKPARRRTRRLSAKAGWLRDRAAALPLRLGQGEPARSTSQRRRRLRPLERCRSGSERRTLPRCSWGRAWIHFATSIEPSLPARFELTSLLRQPKTVTADANTTKASRRCLLADTYGYPRLPVRSTGDHEPRHRRRDSDCSGGEQYEGASDRAEGQCEPHIRVEP
jgi:hypothetical protein